MSQNLHPGLVKNAYHLIKDQVRRTPLLMSAGLSALASNIKLFSATEETHSSPLITLYFKCENLQHTGSFKYRGVAHSLASLSSSDLKRGLLTTSSGNHAIALASVAKALSKERGHAIPVCVIMPSGASPLKVRNVESLGARVVRSGNSWQERETALESMRKRHGLTLVSSSDNQNVILGQGTIGIEIREQMGSEFGNDLDAIVLPCGGGGLLSGVGIALKEEDTQVFGAEPQDGADDGLRGLQLGERIEEVTTETIADGLRCPLGKLPWGIIKDPAFVNGIFTASDLHIRYSMSLLKEALDMVVEPSAAVPLAIVLFNRDFRRYVAHFKRRLHVGVVLSGGNYDKDCSGSNI